MKKKPKIVSLFSGCGGLDYGFNNAGFNIVFSTDIWDKACDTLKLNFNETEVINEDIERIDFKEILEKYNNIDGLIGGPPCPPFSKSRFYLKDKKRGIDDNEGLKTLHNYFRALEELNPKFYFFENVYGFLYAPHKSSLNYLENKSKELGYKVFYKKINAADFGVPQIRERFICVGVKTEMLDFEFPLQTHAKIEKEKFNNFLPWVTAGDVLNDIDIDLPEDNFNEAGSKDNYLLKQIPPGDNYLFLTEKRGHPDPKFKWRSRYWSFLLKLSKEKPSWTIQASHSNNMGPFHWKNRFLRIQEISRLQSFPDNFIFVGSFKDKWRQIGNAVPPKLAYIFAKKIKESYFK